MNSSSVFSSPAWWKLQGWRRWIGQAAVVVLVVAFLGGSFLNAAEKAGFVETQAKPAQTASTLPGAQIAQTLSLVTGIAISPLLGVGAVGAWKYFEAKGDARSQLPWFSNPLFWVPALALVGLCFLKDTLGPAVPTALKKPFDLAEVFENKVSALVATGAFLPLVLGIFKNWTSTTAALDGSGYAMVSMASIWGYAMVPFAFAAYCIVWLVAHTIQILIVISPFATVDAALKAFRAFLLSTVTATSFANPYIGGVWALILIVLCYFLAGWAFRTTFFGTLVAWDILTGKKHRFQPDVSTNEMFLSKPVEDAPVRSYGRLSRESDGSLSFRYRPWLLLAERKVTLPSGRYAVGRGLLHSELVLVKGEEVESVCFLPPRYRDHEEALSKIYEFGPVESIGLVRGFSALWNWLKRVFGGQAQPA